MSSATKVPQHTPGPWRWAFGELVGAQKETVVTIIDDGACGDPECCGGPAYHIEVAGANARLIAAAPELLDALVSLSAALAAQTVGAPLPAALVEEYQQAADAAIARATREG